MLNKDTRNITIGPIQNEGCAGEPRTIMRRDQIRVRLKSPDPKNDSFQSMGAYTLVIFICRVVNSSISRKEQFSIEGVRACGTKNIDNPASFNARVTVKSSESVPNHLFRMPSLSKTSRLIAIEPPQQKLDLRLGPSADAIEAFQTERISEENDGLLEMNQR